MSYPSAVNAIIIDWYGPFDGADRAAAWVGKNDLLVPGKNSVPANLNTGRRPSGIYLAVGTVSLRKVRWPWQWLIQSSRVRYIGIGDVVRRLTHKEHPVRSHMGRVDQIWVGSLGTFPSRDDVPPIGHPKHDNQIELAEALLAYFLEATLNKKKREYTTPAPGVLVNRWFDVSGGGAARPFAASPHTSIPDILIWPYDGPRALLQQVEARAPSLSKIMPLWLDPALAKAASLRFIRRVTGVGVQVRLIDALKVAQFDRHLLRKSKSLVKRAAKGE